MKLWYEVQSQSFPKARSNEHNFSFSMDLQLQEVLVGQNHAMQVFMEEKRIRQSMLEVVANKICPDLSEIIAKEAEPGMEYDNKVEIEGEAVVLNSGYQIFTQGERREAIFMDNTLDVDLESKSNVELTSAQVIYSLRGLIANRVTSSVLRALKREILKVEDESAENFMLWNGDRIEFTHFKLGDSTSKWN